MIFDILFTIVFILMQYMTYGFLMYVGMDYVNYIVSDKHLWELLNSAKGEKVFEDYFDAFFYFGWMWPIIVFLIVTSTRRRKTKNQDSE